MEEEYEDPNKEHKANKLTFLEHLEVLRWMLMRITIGIVVTGTVVFIYIQDVFNKIVLAPSKLDFFFYQKAHGLSIFLNKYFPDYIEADAMKFSEIPIDIVSPKMATDFTTAMLIAFIGGVILSFPYIMFEVWKFVKPALHQREKERSKGIVFWSSLLFILGILFGYYVIAPLSVHFLGTYELSKTIKKLPSLNSYMGIVASTTLAAGVMFELPIIVYFLTKAGLVSPDGMRKYRKHSIVVTLLLAAVITPPDVFTQLFVALPIFVLYEISIKISAMALKRKEID